MIWLCIVFPSLAFLLMKKPLPCLLCLVLQLTLFGWLPAAIWAIVANYDYQSQKKRTEIIKKYK